MAKYKIYYTLKNKLQESFLQELESLCVWCGGEQIRRAYPLFIGVGC